MRLIAALTSAAILVANHPVVAHAGSVRHPVAQQALEVTGRVTDEAKKPVAAATVSIPELGRAATTDSAGRFRLTDVPSGQFTLSVRKLGFASTARAITVAATSLDVSLTVVSSALQIQPVNVTATRVPAPALSSPLSTSMLTGDQVHAEGGISLAHAVAQLPGVRSVTSGQQIGKPVVRGLFGPRVLGLAEGSRIEDYSWSDEDAPSIDARLAQRIEVIRGPASVLYGSEALAGVVNVVPGELPFSADGSPMRREGLEIYGGSNNIELG